MNRRALFLALCALVVAGVLSALGTIAYLAHIHALASALITSAREIRTKADAEREIAAWRKRSGENFWQESDHLGGDHNYDAQIDNSAIVRLRIVEPTVVTVGITMRDGRLRCVTVIESTGWYPVGRSGLTNGSRRRRTSSFTRGSINRKSFSSADART